MNQFVCVKWIGVKLCARKNFGKNWLLFMDGP